MAELRVKGEWVGPGEQRTAEHLRDALPDKWVIFAGRKLPGETRDDVDLIVVGERLIFALEEKSWGPTVTVDDNNWYVKGSARPNPLNRLSQLSRKIAGILRDRAKGYKDLRGKRVTQAVILSHPNIQILSGRNHDYDEQIWTLNEAADRLLGLDGRERDGLGTARASVIAYLDDMPASSGRPQLGAYEITGRLEVPGIEQAYTAKAADDTELILKCYPVAALRELGDPRSFLKRETQAINKLAELGRTWRALPFFESDDEELFVVPIVPPSTGQTLEDAVRVPGPERVGGTLADAVAHEVAIDAFTALAELHEQGLVHRALHPRRVWLGRRMRVQFSDLHLARIEGEVSIALWAPDNDISESYRAPECLASVGLATPASDTFSLTHCLIFWLLGEKPGESAEEIEHRLEREFAWATPLMDALHHDPKMRPSALDMAEALTPPSAADQDAEDEFCSVGALIGGRYEVVSSLGRGGFANSWLVYDQQAQHRKVLKEFRRPVPADNRIEYGVGDKIRHENCGGVYDIKLVGSPQYLISEYVEGENLAARGADRDVEEIHEIAVSVLNALIYLHEVKELVHGDVTPANIIVSSDGSGRAKLIDFGLSVPVGERTTGWNPRFGAPEVTGNRSSSHLSDLYGFGASLIYAMLGRTAGHLDNGSLILDKPTSAEAAVWRPAGEALLNIFFQVAEPNPAMRIQSARELLALITSVQDDEPAPDQTDLAAVTNPNVLALRRLYRGSSAGNAGNRGLDDDFANRTYTPTLLDRSLVPRVIAGEVDVLLLSGNPGDGKTSLLVKIGEQLKDNGASVVHEDQAGWQLALEGRIFHAVFDASESHGDLTSDDLMHRALRPVVQQSHGPASALIAINDGRLLQFFTDFEHEYEDLKFEIEDQLEGVTASDSRVVLVDLKRRTLASLPGKESLAGNVLGVLTDKNIWSPCQECVAKSVCPILSNRNRLADSSGSAFEDLMRISHLRRRRRATFRDVRSAIAWLITGDRDCEQIHATIAAGRNPQLLTDSLVHDLAFSSRSNDYLVDEWSDLDPSNLATPALDRYRRLQAPSGSSSALQSASSIARFSYFGSDEAGLPSSSDVHAYRHLPEFLNMLSSEDSERPTSRLLLGMSRLVGAFGYREDGLAISSGSADSSWAILHTLVAAEFTLSHGVSNANYIETMPDQLTLAHDSGASIALTLDTSEILLRAAEGEIVNDSGSDAIRQEIDTFVGQLARQPSQAARIVDSSGSVSVARIINTSIVLETS